MKKLLNWASIVLALAMILVLGSGDPQRINRAVNAFWGWAPSPPQAERLVGREEANALQTLVGGITEKEIEAEIKHIVAMGSRVTGYPGERKAHQFLKQRFAELGLERIQSESFDVSVPIDKGGQLRLPDGSVTPVYALWPNGVRTPSLPAGGIKGPLVYGGKGFSVGNVVSVSNVSACIFYLLLFKFSQS